MAGCYDVRKTLKVLLELLFDKINVFHNIGVGPFTRAEVLCEGQELHDKHSGQVIRWRFLNQVLHSHFSRLASVITMRQMSLHATWQ